MVSDMKDSIFFLPGAVNCGANGCRNRTIRDAAGRCKALSLSVISGPSANICSNFRMIPAYRHLMRRKVILSGEFPLGFLPE